MIHNEEKLTPKKMAEMDRELLRAEQIKGELWGMLYLFAIVLGVITDGIMYLGGLGETTPLRVVACYLSWLVILAYMYRRGGAE